MNIIRLELLALGSSVNEIFQSLTNLNIKGRCGSHVSCPIARYLQSKGHRYVAVSNKSITTININDDISTPDVVVAFIQAFDNGRFPTLEDK
jgi:hypothetical protein